jgi:sarcosine oxidase, subunit alpha
VRAFTGENVAVALYASGQRVLSRSLKYHRPRAFFCLEGHCGGCLMRIGGVPNLRACMVPCRDDMDVQGQNAYPSPDFDVLEAVDWFFPRGMDHHALRTGSTLVNTVVNKVVRQLSGLGRLPERPPEGDLAATRVEPDIAVIGAGPAGLAAATAAASAGARVVLFDEQDMAGGSLIGDPRYGPGDAAGRARAAERAGVTLRTGCTAIGYYPEDREPVLAVATPSGLCLVRARRTIYATGGYAVNRLFINNDRPGVLAARAVGRLLVRHGVKPADRVCVIGLDSYASALGLALEQAGCEVIAVDPDRARVLGAHGHPWVSGVELAAAAGGRQRIECDLVAVSALPSPASEVPRQHGCEVEFRPQGGGFAVRVDDRGQSSVASVHACGDVCGYMGAEAAARMGERVGLAAAENLATGGEPV